MGIEHILEKKDRGTGVQEHLREGAKISLPVVLTGAILLALSYVVDIIYAGSAEIGIGETSAVARFLYSTGSLIIRLIFPLLSAGIAFSIGRFYGISAGLIGGMLAGIGATLPYPAGDMSAISGLMGSILSGLIAGGTVVLVNKISKNSKNNTKHLFDLLRPVVPIIVTSAAVFIINYISGYINVWTSTGLAAISRVNIILLALIAGVMITLDIFGPLYLAAYVFGAASISTGDSEIMASVMAASIVPPLSIGLCALIFKNRFSKTERRVAYIGMLCGLCGVSQSVLYHYTMRPLRIIPPCIVGGASAAVLSMLLGCSTPLPAGGFLVLGAEEKPLYLLLSVLCGVLISAAIMGLLLKPVESTDKDKAEATLQSVTA